MPLVTVSATDSEGNKFEYKLGDISGLPEGKINTIQISEYRIPIKIRIFVMILCKSANSYLRRNIFKR